MTRFYDRELLDSVDQAKGLPDDERVRQIVNAVVVYTKSYSRNRNPSVRPGPPTEMEIRCAQADYRRWSRSHGLPDIGWDNLKADHQWSHIEAVRTIIRAMRDPNKDMSDVGAAAVGRGMLQPDSSFARGAAYDCWISMIDAASPSPKPTETEL